MQESYNYIYFTMYRETIDIQKCFVSLDHPGLTSSTQIEKFQEKAQMELQDYVQKTYPEDTYRYLLSIVPKVMLWAIAGKSTK